jgi:hypothetical protein
MAAGAALVAVLVGITLLRPSGETGTDFVPVEQSVGAAASTRQAMLGEEARDGQLVFVVEALDCSAEPASTAAPAGQLCILKFTVKNASSSPAMLLGRFQYLVDGQSRTYGADEALTRAVPENGNRSLPELNINPEVVVPMVLIFDLPDGVEPTEARFRGTGRSRVGVNVRLQRRP